MKKHRGQFQKGHKTNVGKHRSEETKRKIGLANKGKLKGHIPWNKGKKRPPFSKEWRENLGKAHKGLLIGSKHPNWKGGIKKANGYIYILQPSHPRANKKGYIKRATLVMEKHLGRYLTLKEVVHHINRIKDDDRIKNLKLFPNQNEHVGFHNKFR